MRAHVYNGKTLKKRNYLDENEGEEKASGGGWEELLQFPWQPSFLPHPSVPHPSLVLLILNKHFLSNVLCAPRGGTRILKYSVPGIPSSRTVQTFVYFQYLSIYRGKSETEMHGDQDSNSDCPRAPPHPRTSRTCFCSWPPAQAGRSGPSQGSERKTMCSPDGAGRSQARLNQATWLFFSPTCESINLLRQTVVLRPQK